MGRAVGDHGVTQDGGLLREGGEEARIRREVRAEADGDPGPLQGDAQGRRGARSRMPSRCLDPGVVRTRLRQRRGARGGPHGDARGCAGTPRGSQTDNAGHRRRLRPGPGEASSDGIIGARNVVGKVGIDVVRSSVRVGVERHGAVHQRRRREGRRAIVRARGAGGAAGARRRRTRRPGRRRRRRKRGR